MLSYILRRLLYTIPVVWGVVTVVFILINVVPGDPARLMLGQRGDPATLAKIRSDMGLDLPIYQQYFNFLRDVAKGDLGKSYRSNEQVTTALLERFKATFRLALWAIILAALVGITAGVISAVKQYSAFDYSAMIIAISGVSAPVFWVGLLLLLAFAYNLNWIPGVGYGDGDWRYLILPVITLGVRPAALLARITRSCMLEVLSQDYVRTARAKGLAERVVVGRHAFRNALIPVITILGTQISDLLSGAVLTETIFAWPGIGNYIYSSLFAADMNAVLGGTLLVGIVFVLLNMLSDVLYTLLDPRSRSLRA